MAAASWFIVFCMAGRVVLAFASLILTFICGWSELIFLTFFIGAFLLQVESTWLNHEEEEEEEPADIGYLVILVVCEWLLAFLYCVVAYYALTSDLASPRGGMCKLANDGTTCAAGALAAASAVGLLCVLCSRLHRAEAPLQPQA